MRYGYGTLISRSLSSSRQLLILTFTLILTRRGVNLSIVRGIGLILSSYGSYGRLPYPNLALRESIERRRGRRIVAIDILGRRRSGTVTEGNRRHTRVIVIVGILLILGGTGVLGILLSLGGTSVLAFLVLSRCYSYARAILFLLTVFSGRVKVNRASRTG